MTKPEKHDTAEHLLSPEAIERALDGRSSAEKAKAFGSYLDENPEARAALERAKRSHDTQNPRHTGLHRLEQARRPADQGGVALEPEQRARKPERRWLAPVILLLMGLIGVLLFVWLRSPKTEVQEAVTASATAAAEPAAPPSESVAAQPNPPPATSTAGPEQTSQPAVPTTVRSSPPHPTATGKPVETTKPQPTASSKLFFPDQPQ